MTRISACYIQYMDVSGVHHMQYRVKHTHPSLRSSKGPKPRNLLKKAVEVLVPEVWKPIIIFFV